MGLSLCPVCKGSGFDMAGPKTCETCAGSGMIRGAYELSGKYFDISKSIVALYEMAKKLNINLVLSINAMPGGINCLKVAMTGHCFRTVSKMFDIEKLKVMDEKALYEEFNDLADALKGGKPEFVE